MSLTRKDLLEIKTIVGEIVRTEVKREIAVAHERQTRILADVVGALADSLDDTYAPKTTEERLSKLRLHLRESP